jgi:hypothetical protein
MTRSAGLPASLDVLTYVSAALALPQAGVTPPGDRLARTGDRHQPDWPIGLTGIRTSSILGSPPTLLRLALRAGEEPEEHLAAARRARGSPYRPARRSST